MSLRPLTLLHQLAGAGNTSALMEEIATVQISMEDRRDLLSISLVTAAGAGQLGTAQALIDAGANVEGASQRPWIRPLWVAAKAGHATVVKLLLEHQADVNATDNLGLDALAYARRYSRNDVIRLLEPLVVG